MSSIQPATIKFLKALKNNNNRPWFEKNKDKYLESRENMIELADALLKEMKKHDLIDTPNGKKSLFRIYRDVRFSKNKSPYKFNMSGSFTRSTKQLRGGYYFHIQPGGSFAGGGFWDPKPADLKLIREHIAADDQQLRKIVKSAAFKRNFGNLEGDQVKTAPRGYSIDHPAIDLLRYKQFLVTKTYTDKEIQDKNFHKELNKTFKAMRPFFDCMSEMLTTDLNGVPLYK